MSCSYNVRLGFLINTVFLGVMERSFSFELGTCWHHIKAKSYAPTISYSSNIQIQLNYNSDQGGKEGMCDTTAQG